MKFLSKKPVRTFPHIKTTDAEKILALCKKEKIDLIDIGQEDAIEIGITNVLINHGFSVVGPTKEAGQIEWDKAYARNFMVKYHIPHPKFFVFHSQTKGIAFLKKQPKHKKWFIKASGLAQGKGALPGKSSLEAIRRIKELSRFGRAGKTYLIEEWIEGEEFSLFAACDGSSFQILGAAQDHKQAFNFDQGENTGGMGCVSPPLMMNAAILAYIKKHIVAKTIQGLALENRTYKGILYVGGIIDATGNVLVIEFNARWGDPEAQVILPSLQTDLFELGNAVSHGNLDNINIKTDLKTRIVVTASSKGYPQDYSAAKGKRIFGIELLANLDNVTIYPAGIRVKRNLMFTNGGRLFYIVGTGENVLEAKSNAYGALSVIFVAGNNLHYRTDIGWKDVSRAFTKKKNVLGYNYGSVEKT